MQTINFWTCVLVVGAWVVAQKDHKAPRERIDPQHAPSSPCDCSYRGWKERPRVRDGNAQEHNSCIISTVEIKQPGIHRLRLSAVEVPEREQLFRLKGIELVRK